MSSPSKNISETPDSFLMAALPNGYAIRRFTDFRQLYLDAFTVRKLLEESPETDGSQYLVLLGLSKQIIDQLANRELTSINYRFAWEGTVGLMKVIPGSAHEQVTCYLTNLVWFKIGAMGRGDYLDELATGGATTYRPTGNKGKEADQCFIPAHRKGLHGAAPPGWPTLVIETGVSESLTRLRQDARFWFSQSHGEVYMVLVITIKRTKVTFEVWYLAPPNTPKPLTNARIHELQNLDLPPMVHQFPNDQQAYCHHLVEVASAAPGVQVPEVTGAPLVLPFEAIFCRPPAQGETDIILESRDLIRIVGHVL
ncbi:hypothetical protein N7454_003735 [Penicillium verhagenii]|nr:hypothetical protein N7454_003735 [Penicillium verhagenii]